MAKELRKKRLDIVHARESLAVVLREIDSKTKLAQRAVIAGIFDIAGVEEEKSSTLMSAVTPLAKAGPVVISAVLYDLTVDNLNKQARHPQLFLHACERLVPNRAEEHEGEIRPLAAHLYIGVQNFSGAWDLFEMLSSTTVEITLSKWQEDERVEAK